MNQLSREQKRFVTVHRVQGRVPLALSGFHVDPALKRGAACWSAVWVGGVCQAAPGERHWTFLLHLVSFSLLADVWQVLPPRFVLMGRLADASDASDARCRSVGTSGKP